MKEEMTEDAFRTVKELNVSEYPLQLDYLFATDDDAPRAHLSVNKIENGYAECDVRLTAADTKGE